MAPMDAICFPFNLKPVLEYRGSTVAAQPSAI